MLGVLPPRDADAQTADDPMAVEPEIALSDDDDDPPESPEDLLPRAQQEPRQAATEVRERLLEMFHQWNDQLEHQKPVPRCLLETEWLLATRMPAWLPEGDDRFHSHKKSRIFVCDTDECGQVVCFSSERHGTDFKRADCEFAGSFTCQDWDDLLAWLRYHAWNERLINTTWNCSHTCGAPTTLNEEQKQTRLNRIRAWQEKGAREEAGKGDATASSSAAGSAHPRGGKGAKTGKRTRPLEHADAVAGDHKGAAKGTRKGSSGEQGKAGKRRRWGH